MTRPCLQESELLLLVNGELSANRAALLSQHLELCSVCQATSSSWQELQRGIGADVPNLAPQSATNAVMRRIRAGESTPARNGALRAWHLGLGSVVAAVALLLIVVLGESSDRRPQSFQARGANTESELARKVGADFYVMRDGALTNLTHASSLGAGEGLTLSYINAVRDKSVYMLAFVVDSQREVHWLYPAFTDPDTDPLAIELRIGDRQIVLPDTVEMDAPATGAGTLIWIASTQRRAVSSIETIAKEERTLNGLRKRWPESEVGHVSVQIENN